MTKILMILPVLLGAVTVAAAPPPAAVYTVTFEATWSEQTHPVSFPGGAHFSGLIGGSHGDSVSFWAPGSLATTGIRQMAEWGSQTALAAEVEVAVGAGTAGAVLAGDVLWTSPGQTSLTFTVTDEFPLVTLVTMIAPSPDWFAGVAGLSLLEQGAWLAEVVVPLYPHDAGTDSGANYTSADQATNPAEPIAAITGGPFTPGVPVGTLTFRLDAVAAAAAPPPVVALSAQPNPFNPVTRLSYEVPLGARRVNLEIFDSRGRRVRRLEPAVTPGVHTTSWNGIAASGVRAPGGVYFVRFTADEAVVVRKVTLLP